MIVARIRRAAWAANVAPTVLTLCDPLTDRVTTSVVTNDLVNRKNRPPTGRIAHHTTSAMIAMIRLRG